MNSIEESIFNSCKNIEKNINLLDTTSDTAFISQNVLGYLRTLVESVALKLCSDDCEVQLTYNDIVQAKSYLRKKPEYKFLYEFYQKLSITKSHFISDDENARRLLLIYLEYLFKLKELLSNKYGYQVLNNIESDCFKIDDDLLEFYINIVEKIETITESPYDKNTWSDYCNIIKKKPFVVNGKMYYEITLSLAVNTNNKTERVIAYTKYDIFDEYSVKVSFEKVSINILEKDMPINIINGWVVAIQPAAINSLARIMNIHFIAKSNMKEYEQIMNFIKTTKYNLLDLVLEDDNSYSKIIKLIKKEGGKTYISDLLGIIRSFIYNNTKGKNIIKYLLFCLDLEIIRNQYNYESCSALSDLRLNYGCIPFEKMPYASSLISHNPRLNDLFRCIDPTNRDHEFLSRKINTNTEVEGLIYTDISELDKFENLDSLINDFNSKVYWKHTNRYLKKFGDYLYVNGYEENSIRIIKELKKYSSCGIMGYKNYVLSWLDIYGASLSDDKKSIMSSMFSNSKLALVYGAAGTGKTTLIKYISDMFSDRNKLYLANTHPAVENLGRIVGKDKGTFSTIRSFTSNSDNSECDVLVIDECSTVSNADMVKILDKVKTELVILVGDIHQIESIVFGNWFSLVRNFLPKNCIHELLQPYRSKNENLKTIWKSVREMDGMVEQHLLKYNCCSPLNKSIFEKNSDESIILCLNYDGLYGVNNINKFLQANNPNPLVEWGISTYKVGDKILFTESERYKPVLYNNLKGTIIDIHKYDDKIIFDILIERSLMEMDVRGTTIELLECDEIGKSIIRLTVNKYINDDEVDENTVVPFQIAYAVSIHKAQGLEYDSVKVVITDEVGELITHNIFYTAITRAKKELKIYWNYETQRKVLSNLKLHDCSRDASIIKGKFKI